MFGPELQETLDMLVQRSENTQNKTTLQEKNKKTNLTENFCSIQGYLFTSNVASNYKRNSEITSYVTLQNRYD